MRGWGDTRLVFSRGTGGVGIVAGYVGGRRKKGQRVQLDR